MQVLIIKQNNKKKVNCKKQSVVWEEKAKKNTTCRAGKRRTRNEIFGLLSKTPNMVMDYVKGSKNLHKSR